MIDKLHFSAAQKKDIPALNGLVNSAYRGESSRQGWTTEADLLDGIRTDEPALEHMIGSPGTIIMKCEDEAGNLAGCVYLQKQEDQLYLGMLTVAPSIQARGIGKQLLSAAEQYAADQGCRSVIMTVITDRHELIAWYERRGYSRTGERKPFPDDPRFGIPRQSLEFVVMKKDIQ